MIAFKHTAAAAAAIVLLAGCGAGATSSNAAVSVTTSPVVRTDIVSRQQLPGTLTYAGSYTVVNQAGPGVFTTVPIPGAVVTRGQVLYRVNGQAITLFYGEAPAWRTLAAGAAPGTDINELQANLVALGFAPSALKVDNYFDQFTAVAVKHWQSSLGLPQTGVVHPGDAIYMPGPIRVTSVESSAGVSAEPGQPFLQATSTVHTVLVQLSVDLEPFVKVGDTTSVAMPDGHTTASGVVASIGTVAVAPANSNQDGPPHGASVLMTITLTDPAVAGTLDLAPVSVGIIHEVHKGVLAVPVTALLAQPDGTYAVAVVTSGQRHIVRVTTGLFDDRGLIEVSGDQLSEGLLVEVPTA